MGIPLLVAIKGYFGSSSFIYFVVLQALLQFPASCTKVKNNTFGAVFNVYLSEQCLLNSGQFIDTG